MKYNVCDLAAPANEIQHLWSVAGYDYEIQDLPYPGASDN